MNRDNHTSVAVQAFAVLYGLSNLPSEHAVDMNQNVLSPLVGKTWTELLALKNDPENKNRPETRALKRLEKVIDVESQLTFPDLLQPLNGMTGDQIRCIQPSESCVRIRKKTRRAPFPFPFVVVCLCILALYAVSTRRCETKMCDECVSCPACPECQCPKRPECQKRPEERPVQDTQKTSFDSCIRILMARENGDPNKALLLDLKTSTKKQIKKAVRVIIKDIHPDKVSPGLRVVCTEASSYISQFL